MTQDQFIRQALILILSKLRDPEKAEHSAELLLLVDQLADRHVEMMKEGR